MRDFFARHEVPFEIAPGVYALDNAWGSWCYLLVGDEVLLVDTGAPGRAGAIVRAIRQVGIEPTAVDRIVLTHFDLDHSGSARALKQSLDAPVVIHTDDAPYLAAPEACPKSRGVLYWPWFTWVLRWRPPEADQLVQAGDTIDGWRVMHTPGHTPGCLSLLRDGVAVVGDALVCRGGRLHLNVRWLCTDWSQHVASARALVATEASIVLPGHYSPCTDPNSLADLGRRMGFANA